MMALLRESVDVALPESAPAAPSAAMFSASGSRKRKREATPPEPTFETLIADADAEVLRAEKAVKRAELALEAWSGRNT